MLARNDPLLKIRASDNCTSETRTIQGPPVPLQCAVGHIFLYGAFVHDH